MKFQIFMNLKCMFQSFISIYFWRRCLNLFGTTSGQSPDDTMQKCKFLHLLESDSKTSSQCDLWSCLDLTKDENKCRSCRDNLVLSEIKFVFLPRLCTLRTYVLFSNYFFNASLEISIWRSSSTESYCSYFRNSKNILECTLKLPHYDFLAELGSRRVCLKPGLD